MIVLDACVLISHFKAGDTHAQDAGNILDTEEELIIHPLTLAEILVGAVQTNQESKLLDALGKMGIITWDPDTDHPLRLAQLRASTPLRLPDCCVLDLATQHNATLATFDADLVKVARQKGVEILTSVV